MSVAAEQIEKCADSILAQIRNMENSRTLDALLSGEQLAPAKPFTLFGERDWPPVLIKTGGGPSGDCEWIILSGDTVHATKRHVIWHDKPNSVWRHFFDNSVACTDEDVRCVTDAN
jgi:hypothetical protein